MPLRYKLYGGGAPGSRNGSAAPALLLLLHGLGDNEGGLLPLGCLAPGGAVVASLRAPLTAPFGGFRWFEGYSSAPEPSALERTIGSSVDVLFDFVVAAPETLGTDPDRVYLLGFSQGATVAWAALLSRWPRPGFIAGATVLSGRLMPELLDPGTPLGARCAAPAQLDGVPLLVAHGSDDAVTPVAMGQDSREAFERWRKGSTPLDFRELRGDGHEVSAQCMEAVRQFLHCHMLNATETESALS